MPSEIRYQRNSDFIFRKIVEEMVLIPVHQNVANMDAIFTLNGVGVFIWEQLAEPMTKDNLQTLLLDEYEVDPRVLMTDLDVFLGQMKELGAVGEVI